MTQGAYEFRITVTSNSSAIVRDWRGGEWEAGIDAEDLRMRTIRVLQEWLGRWGVLSEIEKRERRYAGLPVPSTFEVLGEHLYNVVFAEIGDAFEEAYASAREAGTKLQVVLSFQDEGRALASLPWEFLRRPDRGEPDKGYFLATAVDLVLSRFVPRAAQPPTVPKAELPLRVLFVMTIPDRAEYEPQRRQLKDMMLEFQDAPGRVLAQSLADWDEVKVRQRMAWAPHVVHVVGVCKNVGDDDILIALPPARDGEDGDDVNHEREWQSPNLLVSLLTSPEHLPGLVVLHLCEPDPVDFTATFQRLAPVLIGAGIPAVLAMQYPIPPRAARAFVNDFYAQLARGTEIGEAVQKARDTFYRGPTGDRDRLFGTPVLYMHSVDERLVSTSARPPSAGGTQVAVSQGQTRRQNGLGERTERMKDVVRAMAPGDQELVDWVVGTPWPSDPREAERLIRDQMRDEGAIQTRGPVYIALLALLQSSQAESR